MVAAVLESQNVVGHFPLLGDEIGAAEFNARRESGQVFQLIDVREPHEYDITHIEGSKLIPLGQVMARIAEIDASRPTVMICKVGGRSAKAIVALRQAGFAGHLINLKGGIIELARNNYAGVKSY